MRAELEWVKNKYNYLEFDENRIRHILYFGIIWNIFEKECCNNDARICQSDQIALKLSPITIPLLDDICMYFYTRYIKDGQATRKFVDFKFHSSARKDRVEAILKKNTQSTQVEKIEALLIIVFRLRNNLYHGEKTPDIFYEQDENFKYANQLLMIIIDNYKG